MIDLGSTNGTYINSNRIESAKYYELKEQVRLVHHSLFHGSCLLCGVCYLGYAKVRIQF